MTAAAVPRHQPPRQGPGPYMGQSQLLRRARSIPCTEARSTHRQLRSAVAPGAAASRTRQGTVLNTAPKESRWPRPGLRSPAPSSRRPGSRPDPPAFGPPPSPGPPGRGAGRPAAFRCGRSPAPGSPFPAASGPDAPWPPEWPPPPWRRHWPPSVLPAGSSPPGVRPQLLRLPPLGGLHLPGQQQLFRAEAAEQRPRWARAASSQFRTPSPRHSGSGRIDHIRRQRPGPGGLPPGFRQARRSIRCGPCVHPPASSRPVPPGAGRRRSRQRSCSSGIPPHAMVCGPAAGVIAFPFGVWYDRGSRNIPLKGVLSHEIPLSASLTRTTPCLTFPEPPPGRFPSCAGCTTSPTPRTRCSFTTRSIWSCGTAFDRGEVSKDFVTLERFVRFFQALGLHRDPAKCNRDYLTALGEGVYPLPHAEEVCRDAGPAGDTGCTSSPTP